MQQGQVTAALGRPAYGPWCVLIWLIEDGRLISVADPNLVACEGRPRRFGQPRVGSLSEWLISAQGERGERENDLISASTGRGSVFWAVVTA
ncbi:hypothetical protein BaRGS_00018685, partial [Batillaria attramentaria]